MSSLLVVCLLLAPSAVPQAFDSAAPPTLAAHVPVDLVFVRRQIPPGGSVYWDVPNSLPGVGPYSRFMRADPGQLVVRRASGELEVLVDGSQPTPESLYLMDVNAPDVSYDAQWIVFSGLTAGEHPSGALTSPGAWRLYAIRADGSGLRQITFDDQNLDLSQFAPYPQLFETYDDTDPCFLADGRIVFASTRWPCISQYGSARASNLFLLEVGQTPQRLTSERNGAERPLVDPLTGRIVFFRWWRNFRFPTDDLTTVLGPGGGYVQHLGLTSIAAETKGGNKFASRNGWQAASIGLDGGGLVKFSGSAVDEDESMAYGGAFDRQGRLVTNYLPITHLTESAGFGGLRRLPRGPGLYEGLIGVTETTFNYVSYDPISYGVLEGEYWAEPCVLPDGRIVASRAFDVAQDYGLWVLGPNGESPRLLHDSPGTSEVRARVLAPRKPAPILPPGGLPPASPLPPGKFPPYDIDGTFLFDAWNVYFNAPVDVEIPSAPAAGSAAVIGFFLDHQRDQQYGSLPTKDWPILLELRPVGIHGDILRNLPANVPLFEQLRSSDFGVPFAGGPDQDGIAHVAGMNYGQPGEHASCVGCHAGHSMIPLPENAEAAQWTNLAPGAAVDVSSTASSFFDGNLVNRRVKTDPGVWTSAPGQTQGQWVELTFAVPVRVRTVRLYAPILEGPGSTLQVEAVTVRLLDESGAIEIAAQSAGPISAAGTDVPFPELLARKVRVEFDGLSGLLDYQAVASLAEIEVIARSGG